MFRTSVALIAILSLALPAAAEEGFTPLFDGKSLDGWFYWRDDDSVKGEWVAEDGCLTPKGRPRELATVATFGDFDLRLEWKIAAGGNSGVMYRAEKGYHPPTTGPEFQLLDDANNGEGKIHDRSTGAAYGIYPPVDNRPLKPAGEWNTLQILARGNHVEHWLNGVKILDYELHTADWKARVARSKFAKHPQYGAAAKGHIIIQDHGAAVHFRNLRIRTLD